MTSKLNQSAPTAEIDPGDLAERQQCADQQVGHLRELVENHDKDNAQDSAKDSAEYIAVLASQLQRVAETNGHEFLAYLIDMAVLEAWRISGPDADHSNKKANSVVGVGV